MEGTKEDFDSFYTEVKAIEKRDSVLTSDQQLTRLLRPGSTYLNLNPYEVLQIQPEDSVDVAKTKYRRLSILVHPDKNPNDKERAERAFEIVCKAWKIIENEETRKKCLDIVEEAKERTNLMISEKRKKLKKNEPVEEDDPEKYKHAVWVMTMKLFAEAERRRRNLEQRNMEEKKRQREQEIEEEENAKKQREWQKNFDESRQTRVDSWKQFQATTSTSKKVKKLKTFKPPRHKAETR
ncbi:dnaJ homolog subfamily C member 8 [Planococcus citri]|uniref:dnaJ homolog subfamily C member 8 n=1 Tax=Planococcus citri TaxID=170843 RepID=UPI0031F7B8F6